MRGGSNPLIPIVFLLRGIDGTVDGTVLKTVGPNTPVGVRFPHSPLRVVKMDKKTKKAEAIKIQRNLIRCLEKVAVSLEQTQDAHARLFSNKADIQTLLSTNISTIKDITETMTRLTKIIEEN